MSQDARRDEEQATQRRARVLGMQYADTSGPKQLFTNLLSVAELYKLKTVPLYADDTQIRFGVTTTTSQQTLNLLRQRFSDQQVSYYIISDTGYREFMQLYDPPKQVHYQQINVTGDQAHSEGMIAQVSSTLEQVRADDMLAYLVQQAYRLQASDIHLECQKQNVRVRFRIDGVLHPVAYISLDKYRYLSGSIAVAANISNSASEPQSGHINRAYRLATNEELTLNLRVETIKTAYGMDAVMRLFNLEVEFFKLANLGLSAKEAAVVDDIIRHPTSRELVVGPTGSGKTTTLYSLINTLNTAEKKIITLEDPVEYFIPGVVQIPVEGEMQGQDFAETLRAVLRLDPDVVMIGEIRDQDTARTALQAALTGHLVMSTFHASSAAAALTRMLDAVGINPLFANAMHLVMAQRLVRRLDDATKIPYQPDEQLKNHLQTVVDTFPPDLPKPDMAKLTLYRPGSSSENPFGYDGQLALREQLVMNPGVRNLLRLPPNQVTTEALQSQAVEEGMTTMLHDGLQKALAGLTTLEEVYRVVG